MNWDHGADDMDWQAAIEQAVGAEGALVGHMLANYGQPVVWCSSDDFAERFYGLAFDAINKLRGSGHSVTPEIVAALIDHVDVDGLKTVDVFRRLTKVGAMDMQDEADLAGVVQMLASKRRAYAFAGELNNVVLDADQTPSDIAALLERMAEEMRSSSSGKLVTMADVAMDIAEELAGGSVPISTGLPTLDAAMGGGLWSGKLYGLQARMKVGKSLTAGTIAWNVARQGIPTVYVALEMGQAQIAQRMIASEMRINSIRFLDRRDGEATERLANHVVDFAERVKAPLYFVDRPQLGFKGLQAALHHHVNKANIKVAIIDYWQLVKGKPQHQSETAFLDDVAQWMAEFAKANNIAILCPAQENRDGECRFGDGLRMASSMYLRLNRSEGTGVKRLWFEMFDSRYTLIQDIGSEVSAPFWIDAGAGPTLRQDGEAA